MMLTVKIQNFKMNIFIKYLPPVANTICIITASCELERTLALRLHGSVPVSQLCHSLLTGPDPVALCFSFFICKVRAMSYTLQSVLQGLKVIYDIPSAYHSGCLCAELLQLRPTLSDLTGLQPTRLLCPWDSLGKNTGVGCHALLHGIFPTQRLNPGLMPPLLAGEFFTTNTTCETTYHIVLAVNRCSINGRYYHIILIPLYRTYVQGNRNINGMRDVDSLIKNLGKGKFSDMEDCKK